MWSPQENDDFFGEPQEEDKDPPVTCGACMDSMLAVGFSKGETCPICSPYRWPTDASG